MPLARERNQPSVRRHRQRRDRGEATNEDPLPAGANGGRDDLYTRFGGRGRVDNPARSRPLTRAGARGSPDDCNHRDRERAPNHPNTPTNPWVDGTHVLARHSNTIGTAPSRS
jgi:hypothetical protein